MHLKTDGERVRIGRNSIAVRQGMPRTCTMDWSEVALLDKRKMTLDAVTPRTLTLLATRCVKQPDE